MKYALAFLALAATLAAAPRATTVTVRGAFVHSETLNDAALHAFPRITIAAVEHDGTTSHYTGTPLAILLHRAGAPTGAAVRGAPARSYLAVRGSDGYVALYSLAELDTSATRCAPILADERNGTALSARLGPFHVVAPCDRTQARWVRNVTSLTVVTVPRG